jgi:hypothetical protein
MLTKDTPVYILLFDKWKEAVSGHRTKAKKKHKQTGMNPGAREG